MGQVTFLQWILMGKIWWTCQRVPEEMTATQTRIGRRMVGESFSFGRRAQARQQRSHRPALGHVERHLRPPHGLAGRREDVCHLATRYADLHARLVHRTGHHAEMRDRGDAGQGLPSEAQGADLGIAFDGDADRALFVSRSGQTVDGDRVMLICARRLQAASPAQPGTPASHPVLCRDDRWLVSRFLGQPGRQCTFPKDATPDFHGGSTVFPSFRK